MKTTDHRFAGQSQGIDCGSGPVIRLSGGPLFERLEIHVEYLESVDADRLLSRYRSQARLLPKAESYGGWESKDIAGHSLGHYLSAVSYLNSYDWLDWVEERVDYIVAELRECQEANGDGYVLPVEKEAFARLSLGEIEATPFSLNGVWVPFYTLHKLLAGLRDAFRLVGNEQALKVSKGIGEKLLCTLEPLSEEQIQQMLVTEHGGMNEVLADLAHDSGDVRFLTLAESCFHHRAAMDPCFEKTDLLDGLHGNTQIPKYIGLAREYELTGKGSYREAAEFFWDRVVNHRTYSVGGHGESEHFFDPGSFAKHLTPYTCETCNSYNMIKLTGHLFRWKPDARKMDFVERVLVNHVFANIGQKPGEFGYFLSLANVAVKAFSTPYDSWWCCVGTGLENPTRYAEQAYFRNESGLWINLYIHSEYIDASSGVAFRQTTEFPNSDKSRIAIELGKATPLKVFFRHPYWCELFELRVNGETILYSESPSSYLEVNRVWRSGDIVDLHFPMQLRTEALPGSNGSVVSVVYGPIVLAGIVPVDTEVPDPAKERFSDHLRARGKGNELPHMLLKGETGNPLDGLRASGHFATFRSEGVVVPGDVLLKPLYQVYEEHYVVYFPVLSHEEWKDKEAEIASEHNSRRVIEDGTIDSLVPGQQQPEIEHSFKEEGSAACFLHQRHGRSIDPGGWVSYELAVPSGEAVSLVLTYWGGEWQYPEFDILVNGDRIATQVLRTNKPGDFFDVAYQIPASRTFGKNSIEVKVANGPTSSGVEIFGVRILDSALVEGLGGLACPPSQG